ncbi:hypothetical protein D3C79_600540 [compost metagenome]
MLDQAVDDAAGGVYPEIRGQQLGLQLLEQLVVYLLATEQAEEAGTDIFFGAHQAALEAGEETLPLRLVLSVVVDLGGQWQGSQGGGVGLHLGNQAKIFRSLGLFGDASFFHGLRFGGNAGGFQSLCLSSDTGGFRSLCLGGNASGFQSLRLGGNLGGFQSLRLSGNAGSFRSLCLGGNTGGFHSLCLGGPVRLFHSLDVGRETRCFGGLVGDQRLIDDDGLELGLTLLHHQGAFVRRRREGIRLCFGQGKIGSGSGGNGGLGLRDHRRGGGDLRLDGLGLFFLAAETQPGKQTFCHLKNTHFVG